MAKTIHFNWKRFWCPSNGNYSYDPDGFLVDPESPWGKYNDDNVLIFQDITDSRCTVFLGEPGLGKSVALRDIYKKHITSDAKNVLLIDLRSFSSKNDIVENEKIQDWLNGEHQLELVLDSLDEGLLNTRILAAVLIDILSYWPLHRLTLRIVCRTADWPKLLDSELPQLFGIEELPKYELLPLTKKNVITSATSLGINAEAFFTAIQEAEISAFANRPITLNFLLKLFHSEGKLPDQKSEIYQQGCSELCSEISESRLSSNQTGSLQSIQRLIVASRIAAVMLFSNKSAIWLGSSAENTPPGDITLRELSGFSEEIDGISITISEDMIRETIGTGLFNSRGDQRMGFAHNTYMEYLAANYLDKHQIPSGEIVRLITHPDGKVIPQLDEVAIWLATLNIKLFEELLRSQPDLLLRVDKEIITKKQKSSVTKIFLREYQSGKQLDPYSSIRYFSHICHEDISKQLKPYLRNKKKTDQARLVAILIARECETKELLDTLVSISLDHSENNIVRKYAAFTTKKIADENLKEQLKPLAIGIGDDDPDDELKGIGLSAVWPNHISTKELLSSVTPMKNPNLIGEYYQFISDEFTKGINLENLPDILTWFLEGKPGLGSEILEENLIAQVSLCAWRYIETPLIAELFSKLVLRQMKGHQLFKRVKNDESFLNEIPTHSTKRRILASYIVSNVKTPQDVTYLTYDPSAIIISDDIDWVIDNILTGDMTKRSIWGEILFSLILRYRTEKNLEKAYNICEKFTEVKGIFSSIFSPILINSESAKNQKKYHYQAQKNEAEEIKKNTHQLDFHAKLLSLLDQFENGDTSAWWRLNIVFLESEINLGVNVYEADLTKFKIWQEFDQHTQTRLILAASKYLELQEKCEISSGGNRIYHPAVSAFRAFYLLSVAAPEYLEKLSPELWEKWAGVLLSFPGLNQRYEITVHQSLIERIVALGTIELSSLIKIEAAKDYSNLFKLIEHVYDSNLDDTILRTIKDDSISDFALAEGIKFLLKRRNLKVNDISFSLLEYELEKSTLSFERAIRIATPLIVYTENANWPKIENLIINYPNFGEKLFLNLSNPRDELANIFVQKLTSTEIEELYNWLEKTFPQSEDPKIMGWYAVTERDDVGRFRNQIIVELARKGSHGSCIVLENIEKKHQEKKWIKQYRLSCQENLRRNTWQPLSPQEFLDLAFNAVKKQEAKKARKRRRFTYFVEAILLGSINFISILIDLNEVPFLKELSQNPLFYIALFIVLVFIQELVVLVKRVIDEPVLPRA